MDPDDASADEPMDVVESAPRVFAPAGAAAAAGPAGQDSDGMQAVDDDAGIPFTLADRASDGEADTDPMEDGSMDHAPGAAAVASDDAAGPAAAGGPAERNALADIVALSAGGAGGGGAGVLGSRRDGGGGGKRAHLGRFEEQGERPGKLSHAKFYNKFDDDFDESDMKLA